MRQHPTKQTKKNPPIKCHSHFRCSKETYSGWLVTEEEWLIGQHVGKHLQIVLAELLNLFGLVHTDALGFHLLGPLEPLTIEITLSNNTQDINAVWNVQTKNRFFRIRMDAGAGHKSIFYNNHAHFCKDVLTLRPNENLKKKFKMLLGTRMPRACCKFTLYPFNTRSGFFVRHQKMIHTK